MFCPRDYKNDVLDDGRAEKRLEHLYSALLHRFGIILPLRLE